MTKKGAVLIVVLLMFAGFSACGGGDGGSSQTPVAPTSGPPANVSGTWSGSYTFNDILGCSACGTGSWTMNLTDNAGSVTGSATVSDLCVGFVAGTVSGNYNPANGVITQAVGLGGGGSIQFNGTASGGTIEGSWASDTGCTGSYQGTRQ